MLHAGVGSSGPDQALEEFVAERAELGTKLGEIGLLVGLVGVVGQLQRSLSARSYACLELGALGYRNADDGSGEAGVAVRFSWSVNAGIGAYF
jgi:hypothetical protein